MSEAEINASSKKLENLVFHDTRPNCNIVFIGHVDAGKSTTCGQILLLTGLADQRLVEKYKALAKEKNRESWWIAYIMDTNEEERSKGKTVEVGTANFATDARRYSILDAPGHKNYVPAMISGASQADIAILVISARRGEFEAGFQRGGQTREHALLAKTLGVTKIVIAVNKMDEPTVEWSETRFDQIVLKTITFLKQCGYKSKDISSLPMSGLKGHGIIDTVPSEICNWYKGKGLLGLLDSLAVRRSTKPELRIPVVGRYRDMGCVVALGKIESGCITKNEKLMIMPNKVECTCDSICIDDEKVESAKCGENILLYLKGCEIADIDNGDLICGKDKPSKKASLLEVQLFLIELIQHKPLFTVGYSCILHVHSASVSCEVTRLGEVGKKGEKPKKINFAKGQSKVLCYLKLEKSIALERYSDFPQLGRITLRDEGKTIAIGRVLRLIE